MLTSKIEVRTDAATKAAFQAAADEHRLPLSSWVRETLSAAATGRPVFTPDEIEVLRSVVAQVRRVGIHLNQAVKLFRARAADAPNADDWQKLEAELAAVPAEVYRLLGVTS